MSDDNCELCGGELDEDGFCLDCDDLDEDEGDDLDIDEVDDDYCEECGCSLTFAGVCPDCDTAIDDDDDDENEELEDL